MIQVISSNNIIIPSESSLLVILINVDKGDSSKVNIIAVVVPIAIIIISIIIFAIVAIVLLIKSRCRKQQAFIGKKMAYA